MQYFVTFKAQYIWERTWCTILTQSTLMWDTIGYAWQLTTNYYNSRNFVGMIILLAKVISNENLEICAKLARLDANWHVWTKFSGYRGRLLVFLTTLYRCVNGPWTLKCYYFNIVWKSSHLHALDMYTHF